MNKKSVDEGVAQVLAAYDTLMCIVRDELEDPEVYFSVCVSSALYIYTQTIAAAKVAFSADEADYEKEHAKLRRIIGRLTRDTVCDGAKDNVQFLLFEDPDDGA